MAAITTRVIIHPDEGLIERHFKNRSVRKGPGSLAKNGYRLAFFSGRVEFMHRIIWEHVHGPIPEDREIDHINGVRDDNRIRNLRLVTPQQNQQNQRSAQSNSKSGVKGVSWDSIKGKWRSSIQHNRVSYYLGLFTTIEEAQAMYAGAAAFLHTHNPHAAP